MPFNGKKVANLARNKGIKAKDFIAYVYPERSASGNTSYKDVEKNDNPKARTIELMADYLKCSIDCLFDRDSNYATNHVVGDNNTVGNVHINSDPEVLMATIEHLRDVIVRQDKTIEEQNRRIDQLIELAKR